MNKVKILCLTDTGLGGRGEYSYIDEDKLDAAVDAGIVEKVTDGKNKSGGKKDLIVNDVEIGESSSGEASVGSEA
jgi:hypothetical protein